MIIVDASICGPIVLLDETPLPATFATRLVEDDLIAPAHWPVEIANLLIIAHRRERIDAKTLSAAFGIIAALRVEVAPPSTPDEARAIAALAEQERLTAYDAAYLHLALTRSMPFATLDGALIRAAERRQVEVVTFR